MSKAKKDDNYDFKKRLPGTAQTKLDGLKMERTSSNRSQIEKELDYPDVDHAIAHGEEFVLARYRTQSHLALPQISEPPKNLTRRLSMVQGLS